MNFLLTLDKCGLLFIHFFQILFCGNLRKKSGIVSLDFVITGFLIVKKFL